MEIFKLAGQQLDSQASLNTRHNQAVREIEHTALQQNVKDSLTKEEISKQLDDATKQLNEQMESLQTNIRFAYNDKISSLYVNVTEHHTGKVIRKIPTEEVMELSAHFREIVGMLFDKKE